MRRAMTDECPGSPATLWEDQTSLLYEAKPTHSAERRLLYALFLVLFLLFWLSVQDLAACNRDLRTAGRHTTIIWDVSCPCIKKKALVPVTWAQFMPFYYVLYALKHYYLLLYLLFHKLDTAFGCVFIAENLPIGTSTIGDQRPYKPRAAGTYSSISIMPACRAPMMSASATGPSR